MVLHTDRLGHGGIADVFFQLSALYYGEPFCRKLCGQKIEEENHAGFRLSGGALFHGGVVLMSSRRASDVAHLSGECCARTDERLPVPGAVRCGGDAGAEGKAGTGKRDGFFFLKPGDGNRPGSRFFLFRLWRAGKRDRSGPGFLSGEFCRPASVHPSAGSAERSNGGRHKSASQAAGQRVWRKKRDTVRNHSGGNPAGRFSG